VFACFCSFGRTLQGTLKWKERFRNAEHLETTPMEFGSVYSVLSQFLSGCGITLMPTPTLCWNAMPLFLSSDKLKFNFHEGCSCRICYQSTPSFQQRLELCKNSTVQFVASRLNKRARSDASPAAPWKQKLSTSLQDVKRLSSVTSNGYRCKFSERFFKNIFIYFDLLLRILNFCTTPY